MLKLKRSIGQLLYVGEGQHEVSVILESVEGQRVTLIVRATRPKGEVFDFLVANERVQIRIDETWPNAVALAISAPVEVRIMRAELVERDNQGRQARSE